MRNALPFTGFTLAVLSAACATGRFEQVSFAGEAAPVVADTARKTVYVVKNGDMKDTLLESRIRIKLQAFLLERGFVLASSDTADLYVLATFGTGPRVVASTAAVYRPAEVKTRHGADGQVTGRSFNPEHMEYRRVPLLENSLWLMVLSSDAKYFRATGQIRNLWRGEAAMRGEPEELGEAAAYLIVPALKYFGRGTRQTLLMDVREKEVAWR